MINEVLAGFADPALQRAEVVGALAAISLIGLSFYWDKIDPKENDKSDLKGKNGFYIYKDIDINLKEELAWGSKTILESTPAQTLVILWKNRLLVKRGLISDDEFVPGKICKSVREKQKFISLGNTKLYPGSYEFDTILPDLKSIQIYPLLKDGYLIIGGGKVRCFTKSNEIFLACWVEKLITELKRSDIN